MESQEIEAEYLRNGLKMAIGDYLNHLLENGSYPDNLYHHMLQQMELPLFKQLMDHYDSNQSKVASRCGPNRNTVRKKMKLYNLINGSK